MQRLRSVACEVCAAAAAVEREFTAAAGSQQESPFSSKKNAPERDWGGQSARRLGGQSARRMGGQSARRLGAVGDLLVRAGAFGRLDTSNCKDMHQRTRRLRDCKSGKKVLGTETALMART
jgi:hypothetical protein